MARPYTEYLTFDQQGILAVGCMKCGKEVATRQDKKLVHQSHSRRKLLFLKDNSYATFIVCDECEVTITKQDYPLLEKTMKWGHRAELGWKLGGSNRIPLRLSRLMVEGKEIIGRK